MKVNRTFTFDSNFTSFCAMLLIAINPTLVRRNHPNQTHISAMPAAQVQVEIFHNPGSGTV